MPASASTQASALRAAQAMLRAIEAAPAPTASDIHQAIAATVPLCAKSSTVAPAAMALLGKLAQQPLAASKLAGWPWRTAPAASLISSPRLPDALLAIETVSPPWAQAWLAQGLTATGSAKRRALLSEAIARFERGPAIKPTALTLGLAQAGWAQADASVCEALREAAVLNAQLNRRDPVKRSQLRLQALLVEQSIETAARKRGFAFGAEKIGAAALFDPARHEADEDLAAEAPVRVITPAVERDGAVILKAVVAARPLPGAVKKKKKTN